MTLAQLLLSLIERTGFASDLEAEAHWTAAEAVQGLEDRVAALEQRLAGQAAAPSDPAPAPTGAPSPAGANSSPAAGEVPR